MMKICRTCLLEITDTSCLVLQNWEKIKYELLFCVPELEIDLVLNPALCLSCLNALHLCYQFKNLCLGNEQRIYQNMQRLHIGSQSLTLEDVLSKIQQLPSNKVVEKETNSTNSYKQLPVISEETNKLAVIETQFLEDTDSHAEMINNLESESASNIQFVEVPEEPSTSQSTLTENQHFQMTSVADVELPVEDHNILGHKQPIKVNLIRRRKFTCNLCDYSTTIRESYISHKNCLHPDNATSNEKDCSQPMHTCILCCVNFVDKNNLVGHMVTKHNIKALLSCSLCDYICHQESYLITHMTEHVKVQEENDVITID